ncbi:MAG: hypothetical protein DRQ02_10600, partial [Candidatus Latescibacterota bacterium]
SYLVWQVKKNGEEIYTMEEKEIRRAEAQGYLEIAAHYLDAAGRNMEAEDYRVAADLAYNAAELSAKGLLSLNWGSFHTPTQESLTGSASYTFRMALCQRNWEEG